jgi:hypothetical protein
MRTLVVSVTLLLTAPTTLAAVVDCASLTVTQRRQAEIIGACSPVSSAALCIPATQQGLDALFAYWGEQFGYQETVPCEALRRIDEIGILIAAGPGDGDCTAETIDTTIVNPQSLDVAALRWWRSEQNRGIVDRQARQASEVEAERVRAQTPTALPETETTEEPR